MDFAYRGQKREVFNRTGFHELPADQWSYEDPKAWDTLINLFYPTLNLTARRQYNMYNVRDFNGKGEKQCKKCSFFFLSFSFFSLLFLKNQWTLWYLKFSSKKIDAMTDIKQLLAFSLDDIGWFLGGDFTMWRRSSRVLRSSYRLGWTVPEGASEEEVREARRQRRDEYARWCSSTLLPFFTEHEFKHPEVRVLWTGTEVTDVEVDKVMLRDALFALGSVAAVWIYKIVHLRSVLLSSLGLLHILVSLPAAYFVIRVIMNEYKLGVLMAMALFVILGIGVDDIFILVDAWRQMRRHPAVVRCQALDGEQALLVRLDLAYRRAAGAMLVTSITTAAAFGANAISLIPPIRLFGIFMACIVMCNFLLVITWFPSVLLMHHRFWSSRAKQDQEENGTIDDNNVDVIDDTKRKQVTTSGKNRLRFVFFSFNSLFSKFVNVKIKEKVPNLDENQTDLFASDDGDNSNDEETKGVASYVEHWFYHTYAPWLFENRWSILAFFVVVFACIIYGASKLESASRGDRYFPVICLFVFFFFFFFFFFFLFCFVLFFFFCFVLFCFIRYLMFFSCVCLPPHTTKQDNHNIRMIQDLLDSSFRDADGDDFPQVTLTW